jgi:hypothetical protein
LSFSTLVTPKQFYLVSCQQKTARLEITASFFHSFIGR